MVNRAFSKHARGTFDDLPDESGIRSKRRRRDLIRRSKERKGPSAEARRNVGEPHIVGDEQISYIQYCHRGGKVGTSGEVVNPCFGKL